MALACCWTKRASMVFKAFCSYLTRSSRACRREVLGTDGDIGSGGALAAVAGTPPRRTRAAKRRMDRGAAKCFFMALDFLSGSRPPEPTAGPGPTFHRTTALPPG